MRSFSAILVFLLALLPHVLSLPIPEWTSIVVKRPEKDDDASKARVAAYNEADARAKEMVNKMHTVINSDKPEHKKIVDDAFGRKADRAKIKMTIDTLNTEPTRVGTTDPADMGDGLVAVTPMKRPNGPSRDIKLGHHFFAADASTDFRAGTLIHEATHQHSYTGDKINTNNEIVHALADQKKDIKLQANGSPHNGYHSPGLPDYKKVPVTEADLSDKYRENRDLIVKNMHDNADSYRVFAHLCSAPGVARRDLEFFRRALIEADADDHLYLAKRQHCELPKDYFKKKAEAKAAAAKKTTGAETHPTHGPNHATTGGALTSATHGHGASAQTEHKTYAEALKSPAHGHNASPQPGHPAHGHRGSPQTGHKTYAKALKSPAHGHGASPQTGNNAGSIGHVSHPAAAAPHPAVQQKKTGKK